MRIIAWYWNRAEPSSEPSTKTLPSRAWRGANSSWGKAPGIPFWLGEAPGRTRELSRAVSDLREEVGEKIKQAHRGSAASAAVGPGPAVLGPSSGRDAPAPDQAGDASARLAGG